MYKVLAAAALKAASVVTEKIMQSDKTELREVGQELASAVMRVHQSLRTKASFRRKVGRGQGGCKRPHDSGNAGVRSSLGGGRCRRPGPLSIASRIKLGVQRRERDSAAGDTYTRASATSTGRTITTERTRPCSGTGSASSGVRALWQLRAPNGRGGYG